MFELEAAAQTAETFRVLVADEVTELAAVKTDPCFAHANNERPISRLDNPNL